MEGINQLHRKEVTTYKPSDMWTEEEDAVFLKYCEDPRIRCYHMMARDTSARPHELLIKRIGDFKEMIAPNGVKYLLTSIGAGGKTKNRPVSVYHAYPYFLEWISHHPTPTDPTAFLFRSYEHHNKYRNIPLSTHALTVSYRRLKTIFFPRLLTNDKIPENDKIIIRTILQKPWNPYVRRHTSLTEKVSKVNEFNLRQHAGWVKTSQMINRYTHELGDTSNDAILSSVFGIETKKDSTESKLKPIQCVCGTSNRHDSLYCINQNCKRLLSLEGYNAIIEESKKEKELIESRIEDAKKETEQKLTRQLEDFKRRLEHNDQILEEISKSNNNKVFQHNVYDIPPDLDKALEYIKNVEAGKITPKTIGKKYSLTKPRNPTKLLEAYKQNPMVFEKMYKFLYKGFVKALSQAKKSNDKEKEKEYSGQVEYLRERLSLIQKAKSK